MVLGREWSVPRRRWLVVGATVLITLLTFMTMGPSPQSLRLPSFQSIQSTIAHSHPPQATGSPANHSRHQPQTDRVFTKPKDFPVIGIVFYGRKSRVEILRCYVERNLVDNGGWLDEVHWVRNTKKAEDLEYLKEILDSSPRYKMMEIAKDKTGSAGFAKPWTRLQRGSMYIKLDDDVVWMADDTIPRLVTKKLEHPEYFLVSANVINSPLMGWVHWHMGAIHPYLPEYKGVMNPPSEETNEVKSRTSWKYSEYPYWEGPGNWTFGLDQKPPYNGHRWLRLKEDKEIHRTPITKIEYATWGTGLNSWAIAAQEHYSLLENLMTDRLDVYKSMKDWLSDYQRLSINCIAIWADEVLDNLPMDVGDEQWLTSTMPERLGKSVAVDSEALASHFSFGFQENGHGLMMTDVLARYADYAEENICRQ